MIKAMLFDLYDTLAIIDAESHLAVKSKMSERIGVPADRFIEVWKTYTPLCALGEFLTIEERITRVMRDLNVPPALEVVRELTLLEYNLQTEAARLSEHVVETLQYLQTKGFKLGLVTNAPSYVREVPAILGIEQYFDAVIFSFKLGVLKPDPRIYLAACADLEVRPFECIFVGDGNDRELDGARELGMVAVKLGKGRHELLRGEQSETCDYCIDKLDALRGIINQLNIQG
jgi:putative hydrolase of the HAD superfamily